MGAGKILVIVGGILTLLATYLLTFYGGIPLFGGYYGWGIGGALNIIQQNLFTSANVLLIIIGILLILFLLAGVFQLIGLKVRFLAIFGSILALLISIYLFLSFYTDILPINVEVYDLIFLGEPIVDGIVPFDLPINTFSDGSYVSLGLYVLVAGGVLGLIGGIMGTKNF